MIVDGVWQFDDMSSWQLIDGRRERSTSARKNEALPRDLLDSLGQGERRDSGRRFGVLK